MSLWAATLLQGNHICLGEIENFSPLVLENHSDTSAEARVAEVVMENHTHTHLLFTESHIFLGETETFEDIFCLLLHISGMNPL